MEGLPSHRHALCGDMKDHLINPKEIIEKYSVEELSQTAENYFKSISDPTFQMAKPFSSLIETPVILQNMGVLLSGLRLAKTMTVLEFAAGTCWFSRYLNQLQCKTISCDVSKTALEIGRRLFKEYPVIGNPISEPEFLLFDGHKIDLPDASVDRIICNDGFHHIPNQEEVISEFARVLKEGGIAGFSEPGRFHSQTSTSQYEMKNYNVLENDIDLVEIYDLARKHGFTDFKLTRRGNIDLSFNQVKFFTHPTVHKILNAILKVFGHQISNSNIFFLCKGQYVPDSRGHVGLAHTIAADSNSYTAAVGETLNIRLNISNTGSAGWLNENDNDIGVVKIGTHLYDESNRLINFDFSRYGIAAPVQPGVTFEQAVNVKIDAAGSYKLVVDLVSENVCWFENVGSIPKVIAIGVR